MIDLPTDNGLRERHLRSAEAFEAGARSEVYWMFGTSIAISGLSTCVYLWYIARLVVCIAAILVLAVANISSINAAIYNKRQAIKHRRLAAGEVPRGTLP